MILPQPPTRFDQQYFSQLVGLLNMNDRQYLKRGRDLDVGDARVILTAPDGGRWALTVDNAGNLTATSV